jgi:hypothetical protein
MTSYLGYNATLGIRNNNPFNIIYSISNNWLGQIGSDSGFCQFEYIEYGIRAGFYNLINGYFNQGYNTVGTIILKYAPPVENDTDAYINFVSSELGVDSDTVLTPDYVTLIDLGNAIMKMEVGTSDYNLYINQNMIQEGYNMLPEIIGTWNKPYTTNTYYTSTNILLLLVITGTLIFNEL